MQKNKFYLWLILESVILIFSLSACKSTEEKLESYYRSNPALHQEMADGLMALSMTSGTKVSMKRYPYPDKVIVFMIYYTPTNTYYPIEYDSAFNRHDPFPERTSKLVIPVSLIKAFRNSLYIGARADDAEVFFAYKWNTKIQLGTQGDSQFGIMISRSLGVRNYAIKQLASNVYITNSWIP
jgi:hypothetical protein